VGTVQPPLLTSPTPRRRPLGKDQRTEAIALYSLLVALSGWVLLLRLTSWGNLRAQWLPLLLFAALSLAVKRLGFQVARDVTHSLVSIVDLAALFAFGPSIAAWVAALSGFAYLESRALRDRLLSWRFLGELPLFSSGLRVWMVIAAGVAYTALGGQYTPRSLDWHMLDPLFVTFTLWFAMDHLAWGIRALLRGGVPGLKEFLQKVAGSSLAVEFLPLPFSVVLALVYVDVGLPAFLLMALALLASGTLLQRSSRMRVQIEDHLAELESLNELGYALVEVALNVEALCGLLGEHIARLIASPTMTLDLARGTSDELWRALHVVDGKRQAANTVAMTAAMQWMARARTPVLRADLARERLPFADDLAGARGTAFVLPLLAGTALVGPLARRICPP